MSGCGFGKSFVGTARRVEDPLESDSRHRPREARTRLARRDRQQVSRRVEVDKQLARAGKQRNLRFARKVVFAVACAEFRIAAGRQFRRNLFHRIGQAESDHMPCGHVVRNRLTQVAARLLQCLADERRGIDEGPIPIENDEIEATRRGITHRAI